MLKKSTLTSRTFGARRRGSRITLSDVSEGLSEKGLVISPSTLSRFETGKGGLSDEVLAALDEMLPSNSADDMLSELSTGRLIEVLVPASSTIKRNATESVMLANAILEMSKRLLLEQQFDGALSLLNFARTFAAASEDQIQLGWIDYYTAECDLQNTLRNAGAQAEGSDFDEVVTRFRLAFHSTDLFVTANNNQRSRAWLSALILRANSAEALARVLVRKYRRLREPGSRKDLQAAFLTADDTFEQVRSLLLQFQPDGFEVVLAKLCVARADLIRTIEPQLTGQDKTVLERPILLLREAIRLQMGAARAARSVDKLDTLATFHRKIAEVLEFGQDLQSKSSAAWHAILARELCLSADPSLDELVSASRGRLVKDSGANGGLYFERLEKHLLSINVIGCEYEIDPPLFEG